MATEYSIKGKVFLITGAAAGVGNACAEKFLKEGAKHVAILDVTAAAGEASAKELNSTYGAGRASFVRCDVTDEAALAQSFRAVVTRHGRVDVVMNNAGILDERPTMFRKTNDVNWQALVTLTLLAREHMRADRGGAGGTVVNVSSTAALVRNPYVPIYSAAKAAVMHFGACLGMKEHYEKTKVRVLTIGFGQTKTALMQDIGKRCIDEYLAQALTDQENSSSEIYQEAAAAAEGVACMVRRGASGSMWLAMNSKPARDITPILDKVYDDYLKAISE